MDILSELFPVWDLCVCRTPATIESGQKRCVGRCWDFIFLALGAGSGLLASSIGCRIRRRALMNLQGSGKDVIQFKSIYLSILWWRSTVCFWCNWYIWPADGATNPAMCANALSDKRQKRGVCLFILPVVHLQKGQISLCCYLPFLVLCGIRVLKQQKTRSGNLKLSLRKRHNKARLLRLTMRCWKSHERIMLVACFGKTPLLFLDFLSSLSSKDERSRFT